MDKTKSKLAAFFDNDDEETSFPQKPVDDQKLSHYAQGTLRKSKREKEMEAAEAKRKEEEENAAKAYAEFVDAFQGEDADRKTAGSAFVKSGQAAPYEPSFQARGESSKAAQIFEQEMSPSPPPLPKPKGKRAMDSFLEEIKREQAVRESKFGRHATQGRSITSMAAYEGQSGSKDRGDPETSNVFVANLPPYVNEQSLGMFFARVGPVGSVKIMWPRGDGSVGPGADMTTSRRTKNSGLSGFVAFMKRKDAERALRELDGFDWGGSVLRVGWSKAVPVAAKPMYVVKKPISRSQSPSQNKPSQQFQSLSQSRSRSRSREREAEQYHPSRHSRSPSYSPSRSISPARSRNHHSSYSRPKHYDGHSPRRRSRSPEREEEEVSEQFIRTVATEVKGHGIEYEKNLQEREQSNPKYAFIRPGHRKYKHYRSLVQQSRGIEAEFDDDGYNSVYSTDSAEDSERERVRKTQLGKFARRRFEAMLRALSGKRGEFARCMAFSLEHAEAASEVVDIIVSSLLVDGTPVPRKVARLHLICDILHNSAVSLPMAWKFRQEFQSRLGIVFDHLSTIYHSFPGRITAETFKKQIIAVVDIWEDWIVFPPDYTAALRARLEGMTIPTDEPEEEEEAAVPVDTSKAFASKFKASSFKPATEPVAPAATDDDDGEPMDVGSDDEAASGPPADDVDGVPLAADVDGEPIAEDVDGEPMDEMDGQPIKEDLDGEPMGEDVDGEPIKEDVDGEPMEDGNVDGVPLDDDIDGAPVEM